MPTLMPPTVPVTILKAFKKSLHNCRLRKEGHETEVAAAYRRGYNSALDTAIGLLRGVTDPKFLK